MGTEYSSQKKHLQVIGPNLISFREFYFRIPVNQSICLVLLFNSTLSTLYRIILTKIYACTTMMLNSIFYPGKYSLAFC